MEIGGGPVMNSNKWNSLGNSLKIALDSAQQGRVVQKEDVEGIATNSFKDYLFSAMNKKNLVYSGKLPMITIHAHIYDGIHMMHSSKGDDIITYLDMGQKINDYLLYNQKVNYNEFDLNHPRFINNCWKTARKVLIPPRVRGNFGDEIKDYQNFINFLGEDVGEDWGLL